MSASKQLNVSSALSIVYSNCCLARRPTISRCAKEMQLLLNLYRPLTPAAIVVLSYLVQFFPSEVSDTKVQKLISAWCENPEEVIKALTEREFVARRPMSTKGQYCYSITDAAAEAFMYDRPFHGDLVEDCFLELKDCDRKKICTDKWLKRFTKSLTLPQNLQFRNAYDKLHIAELSTDVQKAFWFLARHFMDYFTSPFDCVLDEQVGLIGRMKTLSKAGIAIEEDGSSFVLSPNAAGVLFSGHEEIVRYDVLSQYATVIKSNQIEKMELFFSARAQEEMSHLRKVLSYDGFNKAMEILEKKKRTCAIISLLWGPPGTGKTESAKQLAAESGRDIFLMDASKLMSKWVGEAEKNYKNAMLVYKYIAKVSGAKAPILLLNEADTFLSKRLENVNNCGDKSENNVTNILLQEFESASGIILATTNLIDNLDPAFDRRFLFKTQLQKPDAHARMKIWLASIPQLTMKEAMELAKLEMSGAQINNVVTKRDLAEIYFDGDRGYDYIVGLCEDELATENGSASFRPRIGF